MLLTELISRADEDEECVEGICRIFHVSKTYCATQINIQNENVNLIIVGLDNFIDYCDMEFVIRSLIHKSEFIYYLHLQLHIYSWVVASCIK